MVTAEMDSGQSARALTYYELLGLQSPQLGSRSSVLDIKLAYRRALLRHHPDKSNASKGIGNHRHTIDEITQAYKTLSDPVTRAEYDRRLNLEPYATATPLTLLKGSGDAFRSGLETVDLDDLEFDENHAVWYRSCRCGDDRGFAVSEDQLAGEARFGEVIAGCRGCSLWLRIQFEALEEAFRESRDGENP
jgi:diphthamide biosynthesis protein 4